MPNPNPGNPEPPGSAGGSDKYPQYGLDVKTGKIAVAHDTSEKVKLIKQGYVEWFLSRKAAGDFFKSQKDLFNGNLPSPLHGLDSIGASIEAFYDVITDGKLWRSVAWIILGALLLYAGIYLWFRGSNLYKSLEGEVTTAVKAAA